MIVLTTSEHISRLVLAVEQRVRAEDILKLSASGANAAKVKKAQRIERHALTQLNKHLKDCVKEAKTHLYRPTRRGLVKAKR